MRDFKPYCYRLKVRFNNDLLALYPSLSGVLQACYITMKRIPEKIVTATDDLFSIKNPLTLHLIARGVVDAFVKHKLLRLRESR